MNTIPYRNWFSTRIDIADDIIKRHKAIGEPDAQIILCCAVGTLSAMRWPMAEDNRRFIEFLTKFVPQTQIVSIPTLIEKFYDAGDNTSAEKLVRKYFQNPIEYHGKIYLDNQPLPAPIMLKKLDSVKVDQSESEINKVLSKEVQPDGSVKTNPKWAKNLLLSGKDRRQLIREASYAALIYSDFRCGLVHQYQAQGMVTSSPSPGIQKMPVYANLLFRPSEEIVKRTTDTHNLPKQEVEQALTETKRRLYFSYEYIRDLMIAAANNVFDDWEMWAKPISYQDSSIWAEPKPSPWWITQYKK